MLGLRLNDGVPPEARNALPLLALSSLTMLGGEVLGRGYGGGVLKMEPSEASALPVPGLKRSRRRGAHSRRRAQTSMPR
ncbi:MAG TPA: hypothetical protein VK655_02755 [Solirubrobacteraceae bacterium]|nr:hypothetical protein [Solirubrobacteraceae bacterium]